MPRQGLPPPIHPVKEQGDDGDKSQHDGEDEYEFGVHLHRVLGRYANARPQLFPRRGRAFALLHYSRNASSIVQ
jgi:hypothetical protein